MERATFANRHPWPLFAVGILVGCTMVDPGGQTARALNQRFSFGWQDNGSFTSEGDGSQTGSFTMIEGSLVIGPDGLPDLTASQLTSYLSYTPRADDAAAAFQAALAASTAQVQHLSQVVSSLINLIGPSAVGIPSSHSPPSSP